MFVLRSGYVEDRDVNASINILKRGLSTVGHIGTCAWGDLPYAGGWRKSAV